MNLHPYRAKDSSVPSCGEGFLPHLDCELKKQLSKVASTIRHLSMDAVQKANSGHPGLPLGCAEIGAYLYGYLLNHNPKDPKWLGRDRFILSAGHGSMLLYSCLHLAGFDLSLEDIKHFRQLHSKTPGHPESIETPGVETTTGPLGQGVAMGIGQALGLKMLATRFNTEEYPLINGKVYILAGDGCMMEGVSGEASSLAGHLRLDNVVLIYDANNITLDGPLSESSSEDTKMRYKAYGWDVAEVDGHDLDALHGVFAQALPNQKRPLLVVARTVIGKGSPSKAGSFHAHGSPLGEEEVRATKRALQLSEEDFYVPKAVTDYFAAKMALQAERQREWQKMFGQWEKAHPDLAVTWHQMEKGIQPSELEKQLYELPIASPVAGRKASQTVLQLLSRSFPQLVGGSADLSCSDLTMVKEGGVVMPGSFKGHNIKYGVREFAMADMAIGLSQTGFFVPYIGTFLTFSDYMRNAIRLAALMQEKVVYQFTHDSIFLGEDGPTHQPVEHLASLRAIPGLRVFRPADAREVKMCWLAILKMEGPSALILSRQNLPEVPGTEIRFEDGVGRGAYIIKKEHAGPIHYSFFATGSEVNLAFDVAVELEKLGKNVRVISMPCWEIFAEQDEPYRESVVGGNLGQRVSVEAATSLGWHEFIGREGIAISVDGFGASAPASALAKHFGFTVDAILERIL